MNRLNIDVTSVQSDLRNLESNVSALGNVFDSIKENTEANRTVISNKKPRPVHTVTKTYREQDSRTTGKNERD